MNDDEIWELAKKPVTEFVEAIKEMELNVDRLVKFYLKHTKEQSSQQPKMVKETMDEEFMDEDLQTLSPLARAKLELAIVFAINTCYWAYLVTIGENPSKNAISKDLERIRLFMNRAKEVEESLIGPKSSVKRPKIDKEASKRLCQASLR